MKGPDDKKSLLGHVPPGTFASSSERITKSRARLHTTGILPLRRNGPRKPTSKVCPMGEINRRLIRLIGCLRSVFSLLVEKSDEKPSSSYAQWVKSTGG
ncbi:MAG: hypothetical protein KTR25_20665 [Myxococcales bacterium]|nr:hypothetical protein [Myxococcales bacterium]